MVTRELQAITESGKIQNGILNPNDLGENERILLDKYLSYKVRAGGRSIKELKSWCRCTEKAHIILYILFGFPSNPGKRFVC